MKPLGKRVLVKPEFKEESVSGIILPDSATKDFPETGVVVEVGDVKTLKKGDRIIFPKYGADEYGDMLIMFEEDVLAIIK